MERLAATVISLDFFSAEYPGLLGNNDIIRNLKNKHDWQHGITEPKRDKYWKRVCRIGNVNQFAIWIVKGFFEPFGRSNSQIL